MSTILIVEDETQIHHMIKEYLEKHRITCIDAFSGTEALLQMQTHPEIALVLMDLMLPGMNGEELLPNIKKLQSDVPIIVISAKTGLDDKVELLEKGADDYICKPFALEELKARIAVQLRKSSKTVDKDILSYQRISLLNDYQTMKVEDMSILLTRHEYKIMELLLSHPKQAFTKKEIYEYAWEDFYVGDDKTINVHISNIRNKCNGKDIIDTIWGIGFKLKE